MKGLIIKPYWGEKILKGEKFWEIRSRGTAHRGHTEIIYSGSGHRYGSANLVSCEPLTREVFDRNIDMHLIYPHLFDITKYKNIYAWSFTEPKFHEQPIPYEHPQGAVIWVNIREENK
jgi:hypothetical protein